MKPPLLRVNRTPMISADESRRVHELALRILAEIGLEVRHERALNCLAAAGLRSADARVCFPPAVVEEHVAEMRRAIGAGSGRRRATPAEADDGRLHLGVSSYSLYMHDLDSGHVVPFDTPRLIAMTRLVDSLTDEGVTGVPPGIPGDVHPDLQPLAQYRIAARYSRQGANPVDPTSALTVNHLLDMAEVMERPKRGLPVYLPSPLRLGGESLDVVLACLARLDALSVSSMPSTGANAPLQPFGALALAAAELMGGLVTLRLLTGKPVTFYVGIFPFDLHAGAQVFGSPENMLLHMLCADFNAFYGWSAQAGSGNIYVMSKLPDSQAAADKAAIMTLGAFLGVRHFGAAGTLSLDEIFSAEQLLIDIETRDWVQRAVAGQALGEDETSDWLVEIKRGVAHNFIGLDSTLDYYRAHTWYPRRSERAAIGPWLRAGQPAASARLRDEAKRRIAKHQYELDAGRRNALERIYRAAETAVAKAS